jgi:DNA-binding GntR family transcriptional regulator
VEELRLRLLEGHIAPGERIAETVLCRELEISRTPLREALKVLASEGLVRLLPHRGAMATEVTPEQTRNLFQVLATLEHLVGTLAAEQVTPSSLLAVEALHTKMLGFHERRRRADYFRLNLQIHVTLAEITRNDELCKTYFSLTQKAMRARYLANMSDGRWNESISEHEDIMAALRQKDGAALATVLVEHAERTGAAVVAALQALAAEQRRS